MRFSTHSCRPRRSGSSSSIASFRYVRVNEIVAALDGAATVDEHLGLPLAQVAPALWPHDLTPPSIGVTFIPGVTKPDWIITVSKATDPLDTGATATPVVDPGLKNKNGQRVVVTVKRWRRRHQRKWWPEPDLPQRGRHEP